MTKEEAIDYVEKHWPNKDQHTKEQLASAYMDGYIHCLQMLRKEINQES